MVVDIRPTISRINPTKNVKFVEVCITDEKIFPRCCAITVWEEILKRNEFLSHGFKKQFVLLGSSLKLNAYRGKLHIYLNKKNIKKQKYMNVSVTVFHSIIKG